MQIPVQINVHNKLIMGILNVPKNRAEGAPIIILCYGLDGNRVDHHRISVVASNYAEKLGITFFRFDYRGLGISEGEFWEASLSTKIEDTLAVIEFLKGCYQNEPHTMIALGFSDGCRIATALTKLSKELKGICTWNPIFFPIASQINKRSPIKLVREPITKELVLPFNGLWVGREYLKQQLDMGTSFSDYLDYSGPKLSVFGGNDPFTRETYEKLLEKQTDHKELSIIKINNANHIFNSYLGTEKLVNETMNWVIEVARLNI